MLEARRDEKKYFGLSRWEPTLMSSIMIGNVRVDTTQLLPAQIAKVKAMSTGAKAAALAAELTKQNRQKAIEDANRADNLAANVQQAGDTGWGANLGDKTLEELRKMLKDEKYPTRAEKLRAAIAAKEQSVAYVPPTPQPRGSQIVDPGPAPTPAPQPTPAPDTTTNDGEDTGWGQHLDEKTLEELQKMLKDEKYPTRAKKLRAAIAAKQMGLPLPDPTPAPDPTGGQPPAAESTPQYVPTPESTAPTPVFEPTGSQPSPGTPITKDVTVSNPVTPTGAVVTPAAVEGLQNLTEDASTKNLQLNNPSQQDIFGNTRTITLNDDGTVSVTDKAGGIQSLTQAAFRGAIQQIQNQGQLDLSKAPQIQNADAARQQARDANYSYFTNDLERQKQKEINDKKQELTERGIPLNPNSGSLWGDSLAEIDRKYKTADDQARQQSIMTGDQSALTNTNISQGAHNTAVSDITAQWQSPYQQASTLQGFLGATAPNFATYQGAQYDNQANNYMSLIGLSVDQIMKQTGLTQAAAQAKLDDATRRYAIDQDAITRRRAAAGGGGGGTPPVTPGGSFAGEAP